MTDRRRQHDYVPRNAAQFRAFLLNLLEYVQVKIVDWGGLVPNEALNKLWDAYQAFNNALEVTMGQHTSAQLLDRNEKQAVATKMTREFTNQYLRFLPITNVDRAMMGIPNHDTIRTKHTEVLERVEFIVEPIGVRELTVKFWIRDADHKAKPRGYDGAVIIWAVLDSPPERYDQLTNHALASRTPFRFIFDISESGKTVYIALAWQNNRGIKGAWTNIRAATIP